MPEANLTAFSLEDKTPQELEARRREIVTSLTRDYKGYDDPNVPIPLLQELSVLTGALRRKNAGPPKKPKAEPKAGAAKAKKASLDDILGMV